MNTATIVAAALLGYTWGYHPLDEQSTEFLIQMSPADVEIMASGDSQIDIDVPPEAGPVGRVRIIVGDEALPKQSLPPSDVGDERTAARLTQPAIAFGLDRETANSDPLSHVRPPRSSAPELDATERYGNPMPPPFSAPMGTSPFDDRRTASLPSEDVVPPLPGDPGIETDRNPIHSHSDDPIRGGRVMDDVRGVVDAPPATSPDAYRSGGGDESLLDGSGERNPVVTNVGPELPAEYGRSSIDWDRLVNASNGPIEPNSGPAADLQNTSSDRSPSESSLPEGENRRLTSNDTTIDNTAGNRTSGNWRSWALVTGPAAFGLFWLNIYQWGTYKSIRRRYLSLLRRTGEV